MMEVQELFNRLMESDLGIHLDVGDDAKCVVGGEEIVLFQL